MSKFKRGLKSELQVKGAFTLVAEAVALAGLLCSAYAALLLISVIGG